MKEAISNRYLFWIYKYFFLYMCFLFVIGSFKSGDYSLSDNWEIFLLIVGAMLSLHVFTSRFVYCAVVNKEGIQLSKKLFVPWEEAASISRIGHVYFLKTRRKKNYIFPISIFPAKVFGINVEDSELDQLITMMAEKHRI